MSPSAPASRRWRRATRSGDGAAVRRKRRRRSLWKTLLGLLTKQDSESCRRVHARGFAVLRELVVHRAGDVDDESGRSRNPLECGDALEHGLFKRFLEFRSVTRRRHETERQRASDALVQPLTNELRIDA